MTIEESVQQYLRQYDWGNHSTEQIDTIHDRLSDLVREAVAAHNEHCAQVVGNRAFPRGVSKEQAALLSEDIRALLKPAEASAPAVNPEYLRGLREAQQQVAFSNNATQAIEKLIDAAYRGEQADAP